LKSTQKHVLFFVSGCMECIRHTFQSVKVSSYLYLHYYETIVKGREKRKIVECANVQVCVCVSALVCQIHEQMRGCVCERE
jgi:hypothetical protein